MTDIDAFTVRNVATAGHEIRDPDGTVVAWTTDEPWALVIALLLNRAEVEGLGGMSGCTEEERSASKSRTPVTMNDKESKSARNH